MWQITLFLTILCFIQLNFGEKHARKKDKDNELVCSSTCEVCTDLFTDLMKIPRTCSKNCKCLHDVHNMINERNANPCKRIINEIFCKLGRKIDDNGCATDNCNTWLPCAEENPLAKCSLPCPHGYKMDIFGCPICECRCKADQIGYTTFVNKCAQKCNNRYDMGALQTDNCPLCNCTIERKVFNKQGCKHIPNCPKNCGAWGFLYTCDERSTSCKCDCPMTKLKCLNLECAFGPALLVKDEFGCTTGCNCPEENDIGIIRQKDKTLNCPNSIKCPLECGPYHLKKVHDFRGCLSECRCECLDPLCHQPCPKNKVMNDMYGCPTCDCMPEWTHCPIVCNTSCGPHNYLSPPDERGCPTTCKCNCPRSMEPMNHERRNNIDFIPRPPLMCPIPCAKHEIERNRFGCDSCECRHKDCPSIRCQRYCGPHGFVKDKNECNTCTCNCPKTRRCGPCPNGLYLSDGYGCETCSCKCPILIDCFMVCPFGRVVNENGCEICRCAERPDLPSKRKNRHESECNDEICDKDCEFFKRLPNGCKRCECCEHLHCPRLNCRSGILQVDKDQCPICRCSRTRKRFLIDASSLKRKHCPSIADCKVKCPRVFLKVDKNHCPICECCEDVLKNDCAFLRCNKFQTNKDGCPLCECEDNILISKIPTEKKTLETKNCPKLSCINNCKWPKRDIYGCPTCKCCRNFLRNCPELKCDHYQVDTYGCPTCECQQTNLEISKKLLQKCDFREDEFIDKCPIKCNHLFHKINENNCPICECCAPKLSIECPNLKCDIFKTDNDGCPLCECVEETKKESSKKQEIECQESHNCKTLCQSGFYKSKGQCSTCNCCPDTLSKCSKLKCNIYKNDEENCPICECTSFHSNKGPSQHSLTNSRCPPLNCHKDCARVHGLLKLGERNCHICECCEPHLEKCPRLKCEKFKTSSNDGCPICECA